jgi:hypothetical protein
MNVTVEERIEQIRVNLERARWVLDNLDDDFVIVNIAGFRVYLYRDNEEAWSTRAVVGRTYRKTPVFRSTMRYLVFNPDWTVPYSIATKDILPKVQDDPGYLAAGDFIVKDRNGDVIEAADIDWSSLSRRNFPYTLVQQPGTNNALGEVKFMFPNEHAVYLHDTPGKGLFDRAARTFSSGCVRVEYPFRFAELLLEANGMDAANIEELRQSRQLRRPDPFLRGRLRARPRRPRGAEFTVSGGAARNRLDDAIALDAIDERPRVRGEFVYGVLPRLVRRPGNVRRQDQVVAPVVQQGVAVDRRLLRQHVDRGCRDLPVCEGVGERL